MRLGKNYWKLWTASVTTNFGDGVATIAYPWLASTITRDGFKLGLVVLAGRLPWLVFSLPAGVITDRVDRRKLIVAMDLARGALTLGVAVLVVSAMPVLSENAMLGALIVASLLLGMAEVLRDNSAQTILPAIVTPENLEKANGRMWGAEMVMNSFVGPPVAGLLLAVAFALPFFVDAGTFFVAAALIMSISGDFRPKEAPKVHSVRADLKEGFAWLWGHDLFRPLAITLGILNGTAAAAFATMVLFVQEILGLEATAFGLLLTAGAVGGVVGSLVADKVAGRLGKSRSLMLTLIGGSLTLVVIGLTSMAPLVWAMEVVSAFLGVVWNVITVSLRQRAIPDHLLGRVNSVYRFFGWGMMSIGALIGGTLVTLSQPVLGREWALRLPFLVAAGIQAAIFLYARPRLTPERIAQTEASGEVTSPGGAT